MRKTIKAITTVGIIGITAIGAYLLGNSQAETVTVTEIREVERTVEVVPDGYIDMDAAVFHDNYVDMREVVGFEMSNDGLQLYYEDGSGYYYQAGEID